jgi:hypothetical protein
MAWKNICYENYGPRIALAMTAIFSHRKTVMPKTAKKANIGVPPFNSRLPHQDYAAFRFSASSLLSLLGLCLARTIARQYRHGFALLRRSLQVHLVTAEYSPMISPKKCSFTDYGLSWRFSSLTASASRLWQQAPPHLKPIADRSEFMPTAAEIMKKIIPMSTANSFI